MDILGFKYKDTVKSRKGCTYKISDQGKFFEIIEFLFILKIQMH